METLHLQQSAMPRASTIHAVEVADLAEIYAEHINVAVLPRGADAEVQSLVLEHLLHRDWEQTLRVEAQQPSSFTVAPWCTADTHALRSELAFLIEIYSELFGGGSHRPAVELQQ